MERIRNPIVNSSFINIGIYSIPEAAHLTGLSESRIRRWLSGYSFKTSGARRTSPPVWSGQLPAIRGRRVVSFRDLIEMKFVDSFLRAGVSWNVIRNVQELARRQFRYDHPFSTNRFRTDGNHIVMTVMGADRQASLFDIATRQQTFLEAAAPFREELDFGSDDTVLRWWPLGRKRNVVLDPARCWGRPVTAASGHPTAVIAAAAQSGMAAPQVAAWFEIADGECEDALAFEQRAGGSR